MPNRVGLEEALSICCQAVSPLERETVELAAARGRVLAGDAYAGHDMPPFNRSRLDGYAITREDLTRLRQGETLRLYIAGVLPAGGMTDQPLVDGKTVHIMTGACLPGCDAAVVGQERCVCAGDYVDITVPSILPHAGLEVRGQRWAKGDLLLKQGEKIGPGQIAKLAADGVGQVEVHRLPRVALVNTGDELLEPGEPVQPGKVYSTSLALRAVVQDSGCEVVSLPAAVTDRVDTLTQTIASFLGSCDLLLIQGGSGGGRWDLGRQALQRLGAKILFSGLELLPGSMTVARHGKVLLVNLPGNPGGASLLFDTLIRPCINKMQGSADYYPTIWELALDNELVNVQYQVRSLQRGQLIFKKNQLRVSTEVSPEAAIRPVTVDLLPGQGKAGDIVKVMLY